MELIAYDTVDSYSINYYNIKVRRRRVHWSIRATDCGGKYYVRVNFFTSLCRFISFPFRSRSIHGCAHVCLWSCNNLSIKGLGVINLLFCSTQLMNRLHVVLLFVSRFAISCGIFYGLSFFPAFLSLVLASCPLVSLLPCWLKHTHFSPIVQELPGSLPKLN